MKSNWIKKVKTEICWLTKSENIHALAVIYLMVGATILGIIWSVNFAMIDDPKNKTKIEKTGYFESITDGNRVITITLTNGETYHVSLYVSGSSAFDKKRFNGEEYLSYKRGFQLAREQNIFMVFISIMLFIFSIVFLVIEYLKLRRSKGDIEDIQK